jgi:hypothetical protein
MYTSCAVVGMLLHISGKFTIGKLKSFLLSKSFVLMRYSRAFACYQNILEKRWVLKMKLDIFTVAIIT